METAGAFEKSGGLAEWIEVQDEARELGVGFDPVRLVQHLGRPPGPVDVDPSLHLRAEPSSKLNGIEASGMTIFVMVPEVRQSGRGLPGRVELDP